MDFYSKLFILFWNNVILCLYHAFFLKRPDEKIKFRNTTPKKNIIERRFLNLLSIMTIILEIIISYFCREQEEEDKKWDVFELSSDEWQESYRTVEFKKLVKLLKVAVYLLTFLILLGSAVVSKASLLLLTSGIKKKNGFPVCGSYNECNCFRIWEK